MTNSSVENAMPSTIVFDMLASKGWASCCYAGHKQRLSSAQDLWQRTLVHGGSNDDECLCMTGRWRERDESKKGTEKKWKKNKKKEEILTIDLKQNKSNGPNRLSHHEKPVWLMHTSHLTSLLLLSVWFLLSMYPFFTQAFLSFTQNIFHFFSLSPQCLLIRVWSFGLTMRLIFCMRLSQCKIHS